MQTRNQLGSQIYRDLINADLEGALRNPMGPAKRALMLADAFMLCLSASDPTSSGENMLEQHPRSLLSANLSVSIEARDPSRLRPSVH